VGHGSTLLAGHGGRRRSVVAGSTTQEEERRENGEGGRRAHRAGARRPVESLVAAGGGRGRRGSPATGARRRARRGRGRGSELRLDAAVEVAVGGGADGLVGVARGRRWPRIRAAHGGGGAREAKGRREKGECEREEKERGGCEWEGEPGEVHGATPYPLPAPVASVEPPCRRPSGSRGSAMEGVTAREKERETGRTDTVHLGPCTVTLSLFVFLFLQFHSVLKCLDHSCNFVKYGTRPK
jgi:hypothetical protein